MSTLGQIKLNFDLEFSYLSDKNYFFKKIDYSIQFFIIFFYFTLYIFTTNIAFLNNYLQSRLMKESVFLFKILK